MSMTHAILGLLMEGERHGYDIAMTLGERVGGGPYNGGQVHQALGLLEGRGWAISRENAVLNRTRRPFRITASGRAEFLAWLSRPVPVGRPVRDEMVVKMVFLAEHDPHRLLAMLEDRQREYVRRLGKAQRAPRASRDAGVAPRVRELARDAFRFREEGELRWIEHSLTQLRALLGKQKVEASSTRSRARS